MAPLRPGSWRNHNSLRAKQCMADQHQMGERAQTTRHWREKRGHLFHASKIDITDNFSINGIDARIQHDCTRLHHISSDTARASRTHHEDIGAPGNTGEVLRIRVADGYCSILAQQDKCNRLATNIATSHNNSIATGHREISIAQDRAHAAPARSHYA